LEGNLGKHEETIKRWIRSGKFPNAYRNSDKEGWRVIESDLLKLNNDRLIKKGITVTFANVAQWSKEVDTEGKGIQENAIRLNEELYECYKQHSKTFKQKENSKGIKPNNLNLDVNFRTLKPDRNLDNLHRKYMKLSKQELVQRLILVE